MAAFVGAYNLARRLRSLGGLTPFDAICKAWTKEPHRFRLSPDHLTSGLNTIGDSNVGAPDLITDWLAGDHIGLSAIDADTKTNKDQAFHFGATAGHAGDIVVTYDAAHNRTVVDLDVDKDAKADAEIWLSGNHALSRRLRVLGAIIAPLRGEMDAAMHWGPSRLGDQSSSAQSPNVAPEGER